MLDTGGSQCVTSTDGRWAPHSLFNHGVWDSVAEDWVVHNLSTATATWHAAALSLRYDDRGDRPDGHARYLDPPTHIELHVTARRTEIALLHMWVRESDAWHGYLTYLERDPRDGGRWAPASALRPLSQAEIAAFGERQAVRRAMGAAGAPAT